MSELFLVRSVSINVDQLMNMLVLTCSMFVKNFFMFCFCSEEEEDEEHEDVVSVYQII